MSFMEVKPVNCPNCGMPVDDGAVFCKTCGRPTNISTPPVTVSRLYPKAERKPVTLTADERCTAILLAAVAAVLTAALLAVLVSTGCFGLF